MSELQSEMIPYTPEELIAIAQKELAWCENEMKKASRELGLRRRLEESPRACEEHVRRAWQATADD
jgi:hypothetical protein